MALINRKVADEIATLVARYRYAVEDSRDAVKAAEAASRKRNEEIEEAAAQRQQEIAARTEQAKAQAGKPRNDWGTAARVEANEISSGGEDEEYEEAPPAQPAPHSRDCSTPPPAPTPPTAPKPAPRRQPVFDDDDDFGNGSWLR